MDITMDNVELLAYESASFFDAITDDCMIADEASYDKFVDPETGNQSYTAQIGKKSYGGAITPTSKFKEKLGYHVKRMAVAILTAIINTFKSIGETLRRIVQVILVPLNALILAVTGAPNEGLAMLSKEEKIVFSRLTREAGKIPTVGRDGVHAIAKCIDQTFDLITRVSRWTTKSFAKGFNYSLEGPELEIFNNNGQEYERIKNTFEQIKQEYDGKIAECDRLYENIINESKAISSKFYRQSLLVAATMNRAEVDFAIRKAKELNKKSTGLLDVCSRLKDTVASKTFDITADANKIAQQYNNISILANKITMYLSTFLGKFNIKSNIETTGASD